MKGPLIEFGGFNEFLKRAQFLIALDGITIFSEVAISAVQSRWWSFNEFRA